MLLADEQIRTQMLYPMKPGRELTFALVLKQHEMPHPIVRHFAHYSAFAALSQAVVLPSLHRMMPVVMTETGPVPAGMVPISVSAPELVLMV